MKRLILTLVAAGGLVASPSAGAGTTTGFTTQVSPPGQTNATEPSVAVDRADGTIYVAWQASGTHVARSDDGGRSFVQTNNVDVFGRDLGDVHIRVGGPTPCTTGAAELVPTPCIRGVHRVYVSSLSRLPVPLQVKLAYSDDRGVTWVNNDVAVANPSLIDRPWMAVYPSKTDASNDTVYVSYHDFSVSQIYVATSINGGVTFGPSIDVFTNPAAAINSSCNTVPSDIEVDPETGDVYVQWITADLVANFTQGCNITQLQNFHEVWVAHSPPGGLMWTDSEVYDGGPATNTDELFATLGVDDSGMPGIPGNVYSVFSDNLRGPAVFDIWFSHSSDKGLTWTSGPGPVPPPALVNSDKGTHYYPWIAAGSTGRVDFIWLNTPDYTPTDVEESPWWTYFAQTINGTSATPKFNQTSASSSVMHVGGVCTNGIFCTVNSGNRDLADSISIDIDRGGSAALVWTDQGRVLHGPTHITYGCVTSQQSAYVNANSGLSCKGPAGP